MVVTTYSDCCPLNSRVTVDYDAQTVKFDYNIDKSSFKERFRFVFLSILQFWLVVTAIPAYVVFAMLVYFLVKLNVPMIYRLIIVIVFTIIWVIPPFLVSWYVAKYYHKFNKSFPKFNAWYLTKLIGKKKFIFDNITEPMCEIPLFKNVLLSYKAKGEYAEYLKKIEIKEYPYKRLVKGKLKPNTSIWKCIFLFSKIPKIGNLYVEYR